MRTLVDNENRFIEMFDPKTGFYQRSSILDKDGIETDKDPFMRCFPALIDIGIMEQCICADRCNVDCYQKACDRTGPNMNLKKYESIMKQCLGKVFQVALGGAGDPDTHENFEEILKMTRDYGIIPNYTTSGIALTREKTEISKKYCGAVAVSEHFADYTERALDLLINSGVKTNIHFVVSSKTIDIAIDYLKNNKFHKGINAVVFLLYKPIGLGQQKYVLKPNDLKLKEFFNLIDSKKFDFKIGFDSCFSSGIVNNSNNINLQSIDYCEAARFSMYIDSNLNAMPCSFGNQSSNWKVSLLNHTIQEAWDSKEFNLFRNQLKNFCPNCDRRASCSGGCPICREVTLCNVNNPRS